MEIDPDILRFKSQPVLDIWSSLVVFDSRQRFHPVSIGSKLACFFLAYVPENPNMFSASAPSSMMSLLLKEGKEGTSKMDPGAYVGFES